MARKLVAVTLLQPKLEQWFSRGGKLAPDVSDMCGTGWGRRVSLASSSWKPGWKLGTEQSCTKQNYHSQSANGDFVKKYQYHSQHKKCFL